MAHGGDDVGPPYGSRDACGTRVERQPLASCS